MCSMQSVQRHKEEISVLLDLTIPTPLTERLTTSNIRNDLYRHHEIKTGYKYYNLSFVNVYTPQKWTS